MYKADYKAFIGGEIGILHAGSRLLVSNHKSVHYLYDALRPHLPPLAEFEHENAASFYIRVAFSPDGTHFVCGSSENNAYIWQVFGGQLETFKANSTLSPLQSVAHIEAPSLVLIQRRRMLLSI